MQWKTCDQILLIPSVNELDVEWKFQQKPFYVENFSVHEEVVCVYM